MSVCTCLPNHQVGCFEDERRLRTILAKYGALKSLPVRVQPREARFQPQREAWWSQLPRDVKAVSLYDAIEITDDQAPTIPCHSAHRSMPQRRPHSALAPRTRHACTRPSTARDTPRPPDPQHATQP